MFAPRNVSRTTSGAVVLLLTLLSACGGDSSGTAEPGNGGAGDAGGGVSGEPATGAPGDIDAPPPDTLPDGSQNGSTLNRDNAVELLGQVLAVFTGNAYDPRILTVPFSAQSFAGQSDAGVDNNFNVTNYSCTNGGAAQSRVRSEGQQSLYRLDFSNCQIDTTLYSGEFNLTQQPLSATYGVRGLAIEDQSSNFRLNGLYVTSLPASQGVQWRTVDFDYEERTAGGNLIVGSASTDYAATAVTAAISGSFTLRPTAVNGLPVGVSTPQPLALTHQGSTQRLINPAFSSGELRITADDGSVLVLQPVSADPTLASISLTNASGNERFDQPMRIWEIALGSDDQP